jgi:hypothetical protein
MPTRTFKLDGNAGVMAITAFGANANAITNPYDYLSQLYFHSGLIYAQISGKVSSANALNFSGVARNYTTWDDGDKCGCFITTAVVKYNKQADDGHVLNTLRMFRDTYMVDERNKYVTEYYKLAPKIVEVIESLDNAENIFNRFYNRYIIPAVSAIESKKFELAFEIYKDMFEEARLYARL